MGKLRVGLEVQDFRFLVIAPMEEDFEDGSCNAFYPVAGGWVKKHFCETDRIIDTLESPLLKIPLEWAKPLYEAIRDQFNYGEAERILSAELRTTREHLEDLRKLLFRNGRDDNAEAAQGKEIAAEVESPSLGRVPDKGRE